MRKKKMKLYAMVYHLNLKSSNPKPTLLNCEKIQTVHPFTPSMDILSTHVQAENIRLQIAERDGVADSHIVHPLYLEVNIVSFEAIVRELRHYGYTVYNNCVQLTLGGNLPCCVLIKSEPQVAEAESIEE